MGHIESLEVKEKTFNTTEKKQSHTKRKLSYEVQHTTSCSLQILSMTHSYIKTCGKSQICFTHLKEKVDQVWILLQFCTYYTKKLNFFILCWCCQNFTTQPDQFLSHTEKWAIKTGRKLQLSSGVVDEILYHSHTMMVCDYWIGCLLWI